jgi:hypothetical protein
MDKSCISKLGMRNSFSALNCASVRMSWGHTTAVLILKPGKVGLSVCVMLNHGLTLAVGTAGCNYWCSCGFRFGAHSINASDSSRRIHVTSLLSASLAPVAEDYGIEVYSFRHCHRPILWPHKACSNSRNLVWLWNAGCVSNNATNRITNSVAWVRDLNVRTERPPLIGEVSANFCG